jgi:hypothetical protein
VGASLHDMPRPQIADEERSRIRLAAANILKKRSRMTDKGCSSRLGVGRGAKKSSNFVLRISQ